MSRKQGVNVQNKFIRGLITEATILSFPKDACTSVDNCVFDHTGRVTRRFGFDTEESHLADSITITAADAYTTFLWQAVSGDGNISFYVVQSGDTIRFYNVSTSTNISNNLHTTEISLDDFLAQESDKDPADFECGYAVGNGDLFIVNKACEPFFVSYSSSDNEFTTTQIVVKARDFEGLDDGLEDIERVTATVSGMETSNPNHLYNLYNQGWAGTDALSQWDTARTDLPSNVDYIALYRNSVTDSFDNNRVTAQDPGNRLAPRGHFIIEIPSLDRQTALTDESFSLGLSTVTSSLIDFNEGDIFTDFTNSTAKAFDGVKFGTSSNAALKLSTSGYMGKDFGDGNEKTINRSVVFPSTTDGFISIGTVTDLDISLYGSNSTPSSGTDGTLLSTVNLSADSTDPLTLLSTDTITAYRYVWIYIEPEESSTMLVVEVQFFSGTATFERFSTVEFFAGRVFYGGVSEDSLSNNIYFSQIIENEDQYGKCYQKNDPTSEDFSDLLPDDGGIIKIPDMGTLKRLYAYQNALLVLASNGIWLISGPSGSSFKATDYQVKKISSIGTNSPQSLVSMKGLPTWFGEDGIYTVQFDPNYDSFTPTSLTFQTIDTLYQSLPLANRKYVKGTYDQIEQIAYWLYSSDDDISADPYRYDSVLVLDARTQAFYTWTISQGPLVRSIDFVQSANRQVSSKLKLLLAQNYTGSGANQTFGEYGNTNYIDWEEEGTNSNYDSYFVTGYQLDGETQKFFQSNYVFVFLDQETNASCFVQGIFDTAITPASGKWSTRQQIYNENLFNRELNFRRLKVRGKGRVIQLRFESELQKPFTILGWSIWETVNTDL